MNAIPPVRAELHERYIFNFRMPLNALNSYVPANWLSPQPVQGYGVASFCVLDLRHITIAPLPTSAGLQSTSCARRYAVFDHSQKQPTPAVYVSERRTSSGFGAWFTGLGFSCRHPYAPAQITENAGEIEIEIDGSSTENQFFATLRPADSSPSILFASTEDFSQFIAQGVNSYGLSRYPNRLTKVDLRKEDHGYESLDVLTIRSPLLDQWQADGAIFDSAFRTSGGRYEWTYHGLVDI